MGSIVTRYAYQNRISLTGTGAAAYTGPGDVVSGAAAWWGFRAYNSATRGNNAVRIVRASDSAEQDFVTLANGSLDAASIATFLAATSGKVVTLYDQTGNGNHLTQATDANRPAYSASETNSLPGIVFSGGHELALSSGLGHAQPFTLSAAQKCTNANFNTGWLWDSGNGSNGSLRWNDATGTGDIQINMGSDFHISGGTNAFHTFQIIANGASSHIVKDGSDNTGDCGSNSLSSFQFALGGNSGGHPFRGTVLEFGLWFSALSASPNATGLNTNQAAYWGL